MTRNYRIDNMKFILISFVVIGHLLELFDGTTEQIIYKIIYLFHMPAFIFLTGYFAHFNPMKIIKNFLCPYIIFQVLYLWFHNYIILEKTEFALQFTRPYWLLWYLMTVLSYYLLIPFFQTKNTRHQVWILLASVGISLLAGFDSSIGYDLSLSRFFTFLPYFLCGYYLNNGLSQSLFTVIKRQNPTSAFLNLLAVVGVLFSIAYIIFVDISKFALYGSLPYESAHYNPIIKFMLLFFAICWIRVLYVTTPNKKIPILSFIGKHTFWIYILHGFFIELIEKRFFQ